MARRIAALILGIAALVAPITLAAADPRSPDGQITSVETHIGTFQLVFSVGNLPEGSLLDPKSVVVTADGMTLKANAKAADAAVDPKATPVREAMLVLDTSGSMQGDGIAAARSAALAYAKQLPADVKLGLVTFSQRATVLLSPTTDRKALSAAVAKVQAGGSTALYDGVIKAANAMRHAPVDADKRLLILSDGDDTASKNGLPDAIGALNDADVTADAVAFRLPGDPAALQAIAAGAHGSVTPVARAGDIAGAFTAAAKAFRQQLLVTVTVPKALALQQATVHVSANAGSASVTAKAMVDMPASGAGLPVGPGASGEGETPTAQTTGELWLIVAVCFGCLLILLLIALFVPVMNAARAKKQARLLETHRYRVVGVVGTPGFAPVAAESPTQTAFAQRTLSLVDRTVRARGKRELLVGELERAGMRIRPEEWAVIQGAAVLVTAVVFLLVSRNFFAFILGGVIGWLAVRTFIKTKISRRQQAFMSQLPDTLQLLASSLRTGFSLNQALSGVVREGTEPTASEFARALTEVRLGSDLERAMDDVAIRVKCDDLSWVVMAVRISREVGGNLAETLSNTVQTMRQRAELRGQVRILSAEGRISARILTALPFIVAAALALFRPGYLTPLWTTGPGIALLVIGSTLLIAGSFWLRRIVEIKV